MFDKRLLFPSTVYSTKINPNSFDKLDIVSTVERNYRKKPNRNEWDQNSDMHHYYNDADNPLFETIDYSSLTPIYSNIIDTFMNNELDICKPIKYRWEIINSTAYGPGQWMDSHDHITDLNIFSCVHYVQLPAGSSPLTFQNPASFQVYNIPPSVVNTSNFINLNNDSASVWSKNWNFHQEEDDFLIFPSYLKHSVNKNPPGLQGLRIAVVLNIQFEGWDSVK
jgi:hypothetical protein